MSYRFTHIHHQLKHRSVSYRFTHIHYQLKHRSVSYRFTHIHYQLKHRSVSYRFKGVSSKVSKIHKNRKKNILGAWTWVEAF